MIDFKSTFKIALNSLKVNKMRSILTSLGIIIGVSAVIIMLAVGSGARKKITDDLSSIGSNLLMVRSSSTTSGGVRMGAGTKPTLTNKDVIAIEENCPSVSLVAAQVSGVQQLTYGNQNWSTSIIGTTPNYIHVRDWEIADGRNLLNEDLKNMAKVTIIGETVALNLFGDMNPVNKTIRMGGVPFKVVGILKKKGQSGMGQDQDDTAFIPITTAQRKLFGEEFPGTVTMINVKASSTDTVTSAQKEIEELLRVRHRIGKNKEDDFSVRNLTQMMETMKTAVMTMTILLGSIASVSLLVGGIGIMNIMLVSVTERTKEIGIRMAIGAKASDIRKQFLIESLLLSIAGGLIGVITGFVGSALISLFSSLTTVVTSFSVFLALGFSAVIGVTFGYYPAYKASLLNPIDALRYE